MDKLFMDLNGVTGRHDAASVHLSAFPAHNPDFIDKALEERMDIAQRVSSMILGLRRKVNIKVRQPLNKIMIPVLDPAFREQFEAVKPLVLNEVNVKEVEYITDTSGILVKKIKPNFKTLGPRYGKMMKQIGSAIASLEQEDILKFEKEGSFELQAGDEKIQLSLDDVEILSEDIPGWLVSAEGALSVALDIQIDEDLRNEGIARELINRIQNMRKSSGFDVTDKINIEIEKHNAINEAVSKHEEYISSQTLAVNISLVEELENTHASKIDLEEDILVKLRVSRV
jgi:isoleucyl-tRNA synthetase